MKMNKINRLKTTALVGVLAIAPLSLTVSYGHAGSLMDLFRKKQPELATPSVQPERKAPQANSLPQNKLPIKRAVVAPPKSYNYLPEKLIKIDFSTVDFQKTASIDSSKLNLPILPPYNVIIETGDGVIDAASINTSEYFATTNVTAEKDIVDTLLSHYSHAPHLIWSENGVVTPKAHKLLNYLAEVEKDGLVPNDYNVELPASNLNGEDSLKSLSQFDVALSARILRYVKDASEGRVIADRLSAFHDLPREALNLSDILTSIHASNDPVAIISSYQPQSKAYNALKSELVKLRVTDEGTEYTLPANIIIRPGEKSEYMASVVDLLIKKAPEDYLKQHRNILEAHINTNEYDEELQSAIKDYQKSVGKADDGVIGAATIASLQGHNNSVKKQRIVQSMERLRWLPHDFGSRYVFINQPSYRAQYFEQNKQKLNMKIVVGSPRNQTYFFYDKIRLVTFNPSWGVPRSILLNEMLPKIANDPNYLSRNGYELFDQSGRRVSASAVNWNQVASNGRSVGVRQQPGKNNALGELKILFPNKHDIYLHDTPNKAAFSRDMRAMSHGCVRLENPRAMAAAVLGKDVKDLQPYFGKTERSLSLPEQVPVYLVYFTAWPDETTGKINYFDDVYGRDSSLEQAWIKTTQSRI